VGISGDEDKVVMEHNGYTHIWTAGQATTEGDSWSQTDRLLRQYVDILTGYGCKLEKDCIRTWFFVQNVDVNYQGVVEARKKLFTEHGMTPQTRYITSTGIEGRSADHRSSVLLDAYAVKGLSEGQQKILYAPTHLNPTHEYGVTFERGVCVDYGDRSHIFISGTASIDNKGAIVAPGDIVKQTDRMLENIEVLLAEVGADMDDVAQMIVYIRDVADYHVVENIFRTRYRHIPKVITLAPVCRPGWLIETECIAIKDNDTSEYKPY
jgi:Putative translation initiation inhibitor, yjgF family